MQNNLLRRLFRSEFRGVDHDFRISRLFIRIRDSGELFEDSRSCLGIKTLAVALLTNFKRGSDVHKDKPTRSEEHTSELQSQSNLVCRLLLEKKKNPVD